MLLKFYCWYSVTSWTFNIRIFLAKLWTVVGDSFIHSFIHSFVCFLSFHKARKEKKVWKETTKQKISREGDAKKSFARLIFSHFCAADRNTMCFQPSVNKVGPYCWSRSTRDNDKQFQEWLLFIISARIKRILFQHISLSVKTRFLLWKFSRYLRKWS